MFCAENPKKRWLHLLLLSLHSHFLALSSYLFPSLSPPLALPSRPFPALPIYVFPTPSPPPFPAHAFPPPFPPSPLPTPSPTPPTFPAHLFPPPPPVQSPSPTALKPLHCTTTFPPLHSKREKYTIQIKNMQALIK